MSDRLLKESDVIEVVTQYISCDYPTEEMAREDAEVLIGRTPSADRPQEWIPCSERLPKIGEVVLVTWEWKCKKHITTAYMVTIRGVTYWDSKQQHEYEPLNVLAWMPLPKPWKGADDDL